MLYKVTQISCALDQVIKVMERTNSLKNGLSTFVSTEPIINCAKLEKLILNGNCNSIQESEQINDPVSGD